MAETSYRVQGMTCGHCASAVTEEITRIDGVRQVDVDVAGGSVVVTSEQPVDRDAVAAAVTEAGYQLVG
jgi:copper ion binding protein